MRMSRSCSFTPFRIVRWSFSPGSACSAKKNVAPRAPRALAGPRCGARRIRQAPPIPDDTPPPDLSDAIQRSIFRRIDWRDGGAGRIPIASVRASFTALSPAAFRVRLLDSERRGAIVLRAAEGDDVQPEGALVRREHDNDLHPRPEPRRPGRSKSPRRAVRPEAVITAHGVGYHPEVVAKVRHGHAAPLPSTPAPSQCSVHRRR